MIWFASATALAQTEKPPEKPKEETRPQVKINYLNVCTPGEPEQQEIKAALDRIPLKPRFTPDFEVSRGRTTVEDSSTKYLRLRRDMKPKSGFSNAQFSLSADPEKTTETLVMKLEDPKDLLMVTFEDHVSSSAATPTTLVGVDTPVSRVRLERFGKPSLVLARCEGSDQGPYEPLFRQASGILAAYRKSLGLRSSFRSDLTWLVSPDKPPASGPKAAPKPPTKPE